MLMIIPRTMPNRKMVIIIITEGDMINRGEHPGLSFQKLDHLSTGRILFVTIPEDMLLCSNTYKILLW